MRKLSKAKVFLRQVTDDDDDNNCDCLTQHRIPKHIFYQKFQEEIIDDEVGGER